MRGSLRFCPALLGGIAGLSVFVLAQAFGAGEDASAQSSATTLAVDVNTEGNSASALGTRELCAAVNPGDTFQIDLTVENVTALTALEAFLTFDSNVVTVNDRDLKNQFLGIVAGESGVFDASESVPDEDGRYRVQGAIITDEPQGADGSGVLARLTLEAKNPGLTTLSLTPSPTDIEDRPVAATLTNVDATQIGDSDGDSYFDGPILDADIAVGQACPGAGGSEPAVLSGGGDDGGVPSWLILGGVAGIVAVAAGGVAFFMLRRPGRPAA
jgi:hypothetical protein